MITKDIENFTKDVQEIIKQWTNNEGFKERKLTDTPTDALQVVNKKYCDALINPLPIANGGTGSTQGSPKVIFDHYASVGNIGTGEDTLYLDTVAANQLASNGQKLEAEYGGTFVSSGTATREIKIYFAGNVLFDTGALTLSLSSAWTAYVSIIRVATTVARYMISFTTEGAALAAYTSVGEITSVDFTSGNDLKLTGEAAGIGAATNDIVAKLGSVSWIPAV